MNVKTAAISTLIKIRMIQYKGKREQKLRKRFNLEVIEKCDLPIKSRLKVHLASFKKK